MTEVSGSSRSPIQPLPHRWAWIGLGFAALATTVMAYLPSLKAGFYFDDLDNIVDVPSVHWSEVSLEGLRQVASTAHLPGRVVANVTFALNHVFGGLDPTGYHVVNLLIHLMVGVALMWVCFEYTTANNKNRIGVSHTAMCSVAAATLFLVHPLNTQAVTYVVQRMASMAALFVLVSFGCYLHARRTASSRRRVVFLLLALLAWVLGILSKETAVVLPAVVLAYELVFHGKEWRGQAASALADPRRRFVAIGLFAAGVAGGILLVGLYIDYSTFSILKQYPNRDFNGLERVLTQFRVQIFYLFLFLWPAPSRLSLEHDFAVSTSILQPPVTLIAILFWVACVALAARLLIRRPRIGFPLLAYVMFHAIESAPLNLELVFEHRMYLPMTMLALLLATVLVESNPKWRRRVLAVVPVIAIVLAVATYSRNLVWAEPIRFHTDCVAKAPNKFRPLYNLGSNLGRAGRLDEAEEILLRALELEPTNGQAHNQIGNILLMRRDLAGAAEHYRAAISSKPDLPEPYFNLGLIHESLGDPVTALDYYRRFVDLAAPYPFLDTAVGTAQMKIDSLSRVR